MMFDMTPAVISVHPDVAAHHTPQQIENLRTLAEYLLRLPADYQHFDMLTFAVKTYDTNTWLDACVVIEEVKQHGFCNTIACAVGHGPAAGIKVSDNIVFWDHYCADAFGIAFSMYVKDERIFDYLFSCDWRLVDNTPHGAARRILNYIENGVPSDFEGIKSIHKLANE